MSFSHLTNNHRYIGSIDRIYGDKLHGWAYNQEKNLPIKVCIFIDDNLIWEGVAKEYREDLKTLGYADGKCSFRVKIPHQLLDGSTRHIRMIESTTKGSILGASTKKQTFSMDPYFHVPDTNNTTFSDFGGLWTDQRNSQSLLDGKNKLGWISGEEHQYLESWILNGYALIPNAVSKEAINKLLNDLEQIWKKGNDDKTWVTIRDQHRKMQTRTLQEGDLDKNVKILDTHIRLQSSLPVIFSEKVLRFLHLLFERPALAHQSLTFLKGSQQGIHQDTVFVPLRSPMELVATWIALEDVQEGTGELEYYPGSHRIKDFVFNKKFKWVPESDKSQLGDYFQHLDKEIKSMGLKKNRLLINKGDVLFWAADLAHGGSQNVDFSRTRKSLVTHYSPVDIKPLYVDKYPTLDLREIIPNSAYCIGKKR